MTKKIACARRPWRIVEMQSCVLLYALACCFILQYFGDEDGRDYIHTTVGSLRTDRQRGSPLGQIKNTSTILYRCSWNHCWQSQTGVATSPRRAGRPRYLCYLIWHWNWLLGDAYRAEHLLHSTEKFTIRTTHLSPGSSSAQWIDFSIHNTSTSTGRVLWLR